jgi:hypothetical protein
VYVADPKPYASTGVLQSALQNVSSTVNAVQGDEPGDGKGLDPLTILAIVTALIQAFKCLRDLLDTHRFDLPRPGMLQGLRAMWIASRVRDANGRRVGFRRADAALMALREEGAALSPIEWASARRELASHVATAA